MTAKLRNRLTATFILAAACAVLIGAPLAAQAQVSWQPRIPQNLTRIEPSDDDIAHATAIIRFDPAYIGISGNQDFTIVPRHGDIYAVEDPGGRKLLYLDIAWDEPVISDGPWLLRICGGSFMRAGTGEWQNVRALKVTVDLQREELLSYGVSAIASELGAHYTGGPWKYRNPCPQ